MICELVSVSSFSYLKWCIFQAGVVAHEIGHALGFIHEHQRPDRDEYVTINYDNIEPGESYYFQRRYWNGYLTTGVPYDYSSIMHYRLNVSRNKTNMVHHLIDQDFDT